MRVLIVGDIRLFRDGLTYYLRRVAGVTVLGIGKSRDDALAKCRTLEPDIALVDMAMPESMETVRELYESVPETRIVGISVPEEGRAVIACAEAGVAAYVAREGSLEDLASTLGSVMCDEAEVSPRIAGALLRRLAGGRRGLTGAGATPRSPLTNREEEVASLVVEGLSNKQIASRLDIRLPTVKNHVHNILEKLSLSRRTQIAGRLAADANAGPAQPKWSRQSRFGSSGGARPDPKIHSARRSAARDSRR